MNKKYDCVAELSQTTGPLTPREQDLVRRGFEMGRKSAHNTIKTIGVMTAMHVDEVMQAVNDEIAD